MAGSTLLPTMGETPPATDPVLLLEAIDAPSDASAAEPPLLSPSPSPLPLPAAAALPPQLVTTPSGRMIALGLTRDALPLASAASSLLFGLSARAADAGFSAGDRVLGAASSAALAAAAATAALGATGAVAPPLVAGVCAGAAAVKAGHWSLLAAAYTTRASLDCARRAAAAAADAADGALDAAGVPSAAAAALSLAVGGDAADALAFTRRLGADFALRLPADMSWRHAAAAARALAWLQRVGVPRDVAARGAPPAAAEWRLLRRYLRFTLGAYGGVALLAMRVLPAAPARSDALTICALCGVPPEDVVFADWHSATYKPGHYVAIDRRTAAVVLAVRGTVRAQDVLTDLMCSGAAFAPPWGGEGAHAAHDGMLRAATRMRDELLRGGGPLDAALRACPGYSLVLCGHSLGAGIATLLAALLGPSLHLAGEAEARAVRCYAFAPPATLSLALCRRMAHVTSVIETSDVVPRFGHATTEELVDFLAALHREVGLLDRIAQRRDEALAADAGQEHELRHHAWAQSLLVWLQLEYGARPKLYPAGKVLWRRSEQLEFGVVDPSEFGSILLTGSEMFSAHLPSAYARAILGGIPLTLVDQID
ncbi:hypothetical protein AB1Y20_006900 [Prymnesium parvum]|uniref:sn-1-specific diacylglycerol lipase n=1 Tax=Prymnesium parvum TaxID=97485 RepID=A0AB34J1P3_PRYPA